MAQVSYLCHKDFPKELKTIDGFHILMRNGRPPCISDELKVIAVLSDLFVDDGRKQKVTGRFAYGSFRLLSVRLRIMSVRLRPICQFAYDSYVSFKTELFKSPCRTSHKRSVTAS